MDLCLIDDAASAQPHALDGWDGGAPDLTPTAAALLDGALTRLFLAVIADHERTTGRAPSRTAVARCLRGVGASAGGAGAGDAATSSQAAALGGGVLARVPTADLLGAIDRLIEVGLLDLAPRGGGLVLTAEGAEVADGALGDPGVAEATPGVLRALFGARPEGELTRALRAFRRVRAAEAGLPPYRILTERTLSQIALAQPSSLKELARVSGVGPVTLAEHGEDLLRVIQAVSAARRPTTAAAG